MHAAACNAHVADECLSAKTLCHPEKESDVFMEGANAR